MTKPWVLLVEDSPSDRELTLLALRKGRFRHRVESTRDGVEALDLLFCRGSWKHRDRRDHPTVILLDVNMPMVGGLEVLRTIKSDTDLCEVPVVMLTSSAEQRDLVACYSSGANSYVVKPVAVDEYLETIGGVGAYWLTVNHPSGETGL